MRYRAYFRVIREEDGWCKRFDPDYMRVFAVDSDGIEDETPGELGLSADDVGESEWSQICEQYDRAITESDPHAWQVDEVDYIDVRTVDPVASAMARKRWAKTTPEERTAYARRIASLPRSKK